MFAALVVLLLLGYPVAFALAANGLLFALIGIQSGFFDLSLLQALPERVYGIVSNQTLLAIPFFTFMGLVLERSGMAEELLDTIGQLFGRVRGGLAYAVVIVGALLAATTGVMAASVIAMGLISLPIMLRRLRQAPREQRNHGSGTLADRAAVDRADRARRPAGARSATCTPARWRRVWRWPACISLCPRGDAGKTRGRRLPPEARALRGLALARRAAVSMLPPLVLIFLVLGTIFLGIATPTEGGALGALGALVLAALHRRLNLSMLKQAMDSTMKLTSFVVFILIGSTVFSLVFRGVDGDRWVEQLLTQLPGGALGFLVVVNLLVFVLAFFLDFFEIAFILIPLLAPVAMKLGIDLVWFGVLLGVNMQTSFMHPPFGFALFYLRSVAPKEVKTSDIYWGAVPFVLIQIVMIVLVLAFPSLVGVNATAGHEVIEIQLPTDPASFMPPELK
jgi:TRAP-type mannitol/chloroaromatic compound transport system permease large subunit